MGINLAKHKMLSFIISSFFAGIGGALLAMYLKAVSATTFTISTATYYILLMVVIGGMGSFTGSIIASMLVIFSKEWWLRFLDAPLSIDGLNAPLLRPGFRMVIFSIILMIVVLFFRGGIMGDREFSWDGIAQFFKNFGKKKKRRYAKMDNVLHLDNVVMQFGGVVAVNTLTMDVNKGEIVALIGPNGAGKTTAFNVVTGVYAPTNGAVYFGGECIVSNYPHGKMKKLYNSGHLGEYTKHIEPTPDKITKLGIARTFQNIRLFKNMTVFDNVLMAKHLHRKSNIFSAAFMLNHAEERRRREEVEKLLEYLDLADVKDEKGNQSPLRKAKTLGDCPCPCHRAEAASLRRAGGRYEPAGNGGTHRIHRQNKERIRTYNFDDRAPYGPCYGASPTEYMFLTSESS